MSNGIVSKPKQTYTMEIHKESLSKFATVTLYVQGTHLGFVSTRLRVRDEASLDACYRVIEASALGTLSRKHFWFAHEVDGQIASVCAAYLTHYKDPSDALNRPFASPKLLKRRSVRRLRECLASTTSKGPLLEWALKSFFPEGMPEDRESGLWSRADEALRKEVFPSVKPKERSGNNPVGSKLLGD